MEEDEEEVDIHHYPVKLANQLKLLRMEDFPSGEKKLIEDYTNMLLSKNINKGRIAKAIFLLRYLRKQLPCDFVDGDKRKIEDLVVWVNDKPTWGAWTKSDARGLLKRFYRWLRFGKYKGPYPDEVAEIQTGIKKNEEREVEVLETQEIEAMIRVADRIRDKAFIAVIFEAGLRIGEMLRLNVGSVSFDEHGAKVLVRIGKTGGRPVRLIASAPLLGRWLEVHTQRVDVRAPLWPSLDHSTGKGKRLSYQSAREIVVDNAAKAGVKKRVWPHLSRHTAATRDARFLNEAELKIRFGWSRDSKVPARYIHLAGKDVDEKVIAVYGKGKIEPIVRPEFVPRPCPKCSEKNSPGMRFCGRCGCPLDPSDLAKSTVEIQEMKQTLDQILNRLDNGSQARK
jgi:integrase/recombinase XerD